MSSTVSFPGCWRATVYVEAFQIKHPNRCRSTNYFLFFQRSAEGEIKPFRVVNTLAEADQIAREFLADGIGVLWKDDNVPWDQRPKAPRAKDRKPSQTRNKRHYLKLAWTAPETGGRHE